MKSVGLEAVFTFAGWAGLAILFLTVAGRLIGFGDGDADSGDADGGGSGDALHSALINPLNPSNLAAFFAMFGFVGKLMLESHYSNVVAILGGSTAGLAAMAMFGLIWKSLNRLNQDGTTDPASAIGKSGIVTARIPGLHRDIGILNVEVSGTMLELNAYTNGPEDIPSGTRVTILALEGPTTVLVTNSATT